MARRQSLGELYMDLSQDEQSQVDELLHGPKKSCEEHEQKNYMKEHLNKNLIDSSTDLCSSSWSQQDFDTIASDLEEYGEALDEYIDKDEYQLQNNKDIELQPTEEDYDAVSRNIAHLPPICLIEEADDFFCDDVNAFDSMVLDAAIGRLSLDDNGATGFSIAGKSVSATRAKSANERIKNSPYTGTNAVSKSRIKSCISVIRKKQATHVQSDATKECHGISSNCEEISHLVVSLRQLLSKNGKKNARRLRSSVV